MYDEATVATMREALQAALQSHVKMGKARACDCSLCQHIRHALESDAGAQFADRLREECAQVADWTASQVAKQLTDASPEQTAALKATQRAAKEIGDRIRVLKGRKF